MARFLRTEQLGGADTFEIRLFALSCLDELKFLACVLGRDADWIFLQKDIQLGRGPVKLPFLLESTRGQTMCKGMKCG